MNLPPKILTRRQRSQMFPSQSTADQFRVKLTRLVSRHDEMKVAYQRLKSQIKIGLLEAEEVFASLAIPLMKLVGLKTVEMAEEGRFTTIVIDPDSPQGCGRNGVISEPLATSPESLDGEDENNKLEVGIYATKANIAGRELVEKQQSQFIQLINILRQIESQVNSCQNDMLQTLANHRVFLNKFFHQAVNFLYNLHSQNQDTFVITVKLLRTLFNYMGSVFGSVEIGMDNLMQDLAVHMFNPMVEYVKGLKVDIKIGTCARLLAIVKEMEIVMKNGRLELAEARKRIRVAEEGKIEALCKLKETEERVRRMNEHLRLLPESKKRLRETCGRHKFLGMEEDPDENLLWELLKKKRQYLTPHSPMGPGELLNFEPKSRCHKPTREARPLFAYSPVSGNCPGGLLLGPQTPRRIARIPLGSSPSAVIQQALSRKRINH